MFGLLLDEMPCLEKKYTYAQIDFLIKDKLDLEKKYILLYSERETLKVRLLALKKTGIFILENKIFSGNRNHSTSKLKRKLKDI